MLPSWKTCCHFHLSTCFEAAIFQFFLSFAFLVFFEILLVKLPYYPRWQIFGLWFFYGLFSQKSYLNRPWLFLTDQKNKIHKQFTSVGKTSWFVVAVAEIYIETTCVHVRALCIRMHTHSIMSCTIRWARRQEKIRKITEFRNVRCEVVNE